jgi:hypothetical protein
MVKFRFKVDEHQQRARHVAAFMANMTAPGGE